MLVALLALVASGALAADGATPVAHAEGAVAATSPTAPSAPAAAPAAAPAPAHVVLSADLHGAYLQGQPLLVTVHVKNDGKETLTFPDLSRRPHLVRFELTKNGSTQSRYTTPPEKDGEDAWKIPPGGRRDVLLEVPSGATLDGGTYDLAVHVVWPGADLPVAKQTITLAPPKPAAASGPWDAAASEKVGPQSAWVNQSKDGAQLYLHVADAKDPRRTTADYYLADVPADARPYLAHALPTDAWARHVFWIAGDRLEVAQLQGPATEVARFGVDMAWPKVEVAADGVTDPHGGLHVPVWIPAPNGQGGELRVLSWHANQVPAWRRVATFKQRPDVASDVDGGGNVRLSVHHDGRLDLYMLGTDAADTLPARGVRVDTPQGAELVFSRFAPMPTSGDQKGGLALLVVDRTTAADGTSRWTPRWVSTSGEALRTLPDLPAAADQRVADVVPVGESGVALLLRGPDGSPFVLSTGAATANPTHVGSDAQLVEDTAGNAWIRSWTPGQLELLQLVASAEAPKPTP